ncbi:MAG: three-Cys-motif partner protein TcmP [Armatimonadia bacterium]
MRLDEIGYWTEVKLDIVREYAVAYSAILANQQKVPLTHIYVDAFSGAGQHLSRTSGEVVPGSPLSVLSVEPKFAEYHFIDLNQHKLDHLRELTASRDGVYLYNEDCNSVLIDEVFPRARYEDYRRALCLLDPYGLHLDWRLMHTAGHMKSVEIFLNFPVMDMNMNVLWANPDKVLPEQAARMTRFWGDESWREAAYTTDLQQPNLFGEAEKASNEAVADAFRHRLREVAGFKYVPEPLPMRNKTNAVVYYLFFASQNQVGAKIASAVFSKYRNRGT